MLKSLSKTFIALLIGLTIILPILANAQTTYPINPNQDILHYTFNIGLSDNKDEITGEATILFTLMEEDKLILDLIGLTADGRGMVVDEVLANDNALPFVQIHVLSSSCLLLTHPHFAWCNQSFHR